MKNIQDLLHLKIFNGQYFFPWQLRGMGWNELYESKKKIRTQFYFLCAFSRYILLKFIDLFSLYTLKIKNIKSVIKKLKKCILSINFLFLWQKPFYLNKSQRFFVMLTINFYTPLQFSEFYFSATSHRGEFMVIQHKLKKSPFKIDCHKMKFIFLVFNTHV